MIGREILLLAATGASLGFVHTVIGPDHYLPFIVIGRARGWTLRKTLAVSALAGLGHILGSVVLGFVGIALGLAVSKLEMFEAFRGGVAGWLMIGFGLAYGLWGLRRAVKKRPHAHPHPHVHAEGEGLHHEHPAGQDHEHEDERDSSLLLAPSLSKGGVQGRVEHEREGTVEEHAHLHTHTGEHVHVHESPGKVNITPWVLFTIFVFGPCEPLIPLLMYPAAKHSAAGVALVAAAFGLTTIGTMLAIIAAASYGVSFVKLGRLERYSHALAGVMIALSGLAVQFLGL